MQRITEALFKEGVIENDLSKYYDGKSAVLMCIPKKYFDNDFIEKVIELWESEIGKKYNWVGCLGIPLKIAKRISKNNRRKCSGHTAYGYTHSGFSIWGKDPYQVSPNDILTLAVYCDKFFECEPLEKGKIYRPGTIGIVKDDYSLTLTESLIEAFTGDGKHTFNVIGQK